MDDRAAELEVSGDIWDEHRLRVATEAAGVALWSWNVDTDRFAMDGRAFEIWGLPEKEQITFEELSACIHPADLDKVRAAFSATRDLRGAYETDFRILHRDGVRWVSARGRGDDEGIVRRMMYGVFLDVSVRKAAEEDRALITMEMHHRIKNLFSLSSALAVIASRSTTTKEAMLEDLTLRLNALHEAHALINPGFHDQKAAVTLGGLLAMLLKPYSLDPSVSGNVSISVPEIRVGEHSMTTLAMVIHELATNSAKYGAASAEAGKLIVSCHDANDDVELVWNESGGPVPDASVVDSGFGSLMMERVIKQVEGSISRKWTDEGLIITLRMNKARLGA
jgi:two-component sensor histidine kinase